MLRYGVFYCLPYCVPFRFRFLIVHLREITERRYLGFKDCGPQAATICNKCNKCNKLTVARTRKRLELRILPI